MTAKKINIEVGASKIARSFLANMDQRFAEPVRYFVRYSGIVLLFFVIYLVTFENFNGQEHNRVIIWGMFYSAYMILLEIFRKQSTELYETSWFRGVRIGANFIAISSLFIIAPAERYLLVFAYFIPILATLVYFSEKKWLKFVVPLLSIIVIYLSGYLTFFGLRLGSVEFLVYAFLIVSISILFEYFRRRVYQVSNQITTMAEGLHHTLDLQKLLTDILSKAVGITQAQRGLIIIINPRTKRYIGHVLFNFNLKMGYSIENLAKKCFVLVHGKAFDSPDLTETFNDKTVYNKFFEAQPRSVLAEPLYNRAGQIMGVINVAHNNPGGFEKLSKARLKEFSLQVSNSIENCIEHREVILRESRNKEAGEKFVSADTEDEVIHTLLEEAHQQISHAEKLTLHQYYPLDDSLTPVYTLSLDSTPRLFTWLGPKLKKTDPDLRLGYGIAGHALELRDTILVNDVEHHPWFVKLSPQEDIKSLLVAPLFDPDEGELYGTLSLESSKIPAFNLDDESALTYLSTEASKAIAKIRDFQAWREQGGALRKILEQISSFDMDASEETICKQITDAAARLLGFKIARIRIRTKEDELQTIAITGITERTKKKLVMNLPMRELDPFLKPAFKAESSYLIKRDTPNWNKFVDEYFFKPRRNTRAKSRWDIYDALITPLLDSSGRSIGILTLDLPNNGTEPNKQLLELIGVFANFASWVIELSRSRRRLEDQRRRAQSFIDTISQELAKCRDIPAISEVVVQAGAKLLSAEGCSLYLVRGNDIELTHSNYLADIGYIGRRKPISDKPGAGLTSWVVVTGETLRFNGDSFKQHSAWAGEEDHLKYLNSGICRSLILTPIKDKDEHVIGALTLENKKSVAGSKDFDEDDETRLKRLAGEFARALEVIGLYQDIKEYERTGLAEDIHDLINWHHSGIVSWIEALEPWFEINDYEKVRELVKQLRQHALTFVQELKALHTNFLDKSLEAPTFKQALEETLSVWTNRTTPKYDKRLLRITFDCPEDLEVPIKIRNTIIRFASLAFSNALQHSGIIEDPKIEIKLKVRQDYGGLTLAIIDTGRGFDRENNPRGFGMDTMRQLEEKINRWGEMKARYQIVTNPNAGTKVLLTLTSESKK